MSRSSRPVPDCSCPSSAYGCRRAPACKDEGKRESARHRVAPPVHARSLPCS
jgi:hypothetical protein